MPIGTKLELECIGCKKKKIVKGKDIPIGNDQSMCEICGMPMILDKVVCSD